MKNDIASLKGLRENLVKELTISLKVSFEDAQKIVTQMESEDFIKLYAPKYHEKPTTVIFENNQLSVNNLSSTSYKAGNILLNLHLNFMEFANVGICTFLAAASISVSNPITMIFGILSVLFSLSSLAKFNLTENSTAIIMALQKHSINKNYTTESAQCLKEANEILSQYDYSEMDEKTFEMELSKLSKINCIKISDNKKIELLEHIYLNY